MIITLAYIIHPRICYIVVKYFKQRISWISNYSKSRVRAHSGLVHWLKRCHQRLRTFLFFLPFLCNSHQATSKMAATIPGNKSRQSSMQGTCVSFWGFKNHFQKLSRRFLLGIIDQNWVTYPFLIKPQAREMKLQWSAGMGWRLDSQWQWSLSGPWATAKYTRPGYKN